MSKDKLVIKPKGDDGYTVFSVRLKEETVSQIDSLARQSGHSRNSIIGMLIEYALKNCVIGP